MTELAKWNWEDPRSEDDGAVHALNTVVYAVVFVS